MSIAMLRIEHYTRALQEAAEHYMLEIFMGRRDPISLDEGEVNLVLSAAMHIVSNCPWGDNPGMVYKEIGEGDGGVQEEV